MFCGVKRRSGRCAQELRRSLRRDRGVTRNDRLASQRSHRSLRLVLPGADDASGSDARRRGSPTLVSGWRAAATGPGTPARPSSSRPGHRRPPATASPPDGRSPRRPRRLARARVPIRGGDGAAVALVACLEDACTRPSEPGPFCLQTRDDSPEGGGGGCSGLVIEGLWTLVSTADPNEAPGGASAPVGGRAVVRGDRPDDERLRASAVAASTSTASVRRRQAGRRALSDRLAAGAAW